ncbi:uncharacterized protein LOC112341378 [Selaginella moellendorffii]|uniref:uncharacterized protein LOC112341378 n=1 Tax=Selaginella moellendorffii TaxID=88036 RepID=UPI000D1D1079|nr:uncharacterized protein LOC112341378 [Selaginella moellendorffii]|eukprot:XP_024517122.1 uncharacterized protein LOC112341378 [Selaginella moellendorffii]
MALLELLKGRGISLEEISRASGDKAANNDSGTKNLLVKDKKSRMFLISCKQSTNLDLKALSIRLGVGKGGVRFAPEENVVELLGVPPALVSPFVLTTDSQSSIVLLLDEKFETSSRLIFPVSDELSIAVTRASLEQFLESIGKTPIYVDLEAALQAGKDQADLSVYVPSKKESSTEGMPNGTGSELRKPSSESQSKEKPAAIVRGDESRRTDFASTEALSSLILSTIASKALEKSDKETWEAIEKRVKPELENLLVMFKNTAFTEGFLAARSARLI